MRARGPIKHTCPIIDDCIRYIERAIADPDEVDCLSDLIGRKGILEDIREANSTLRDWGAEQEDLVDSLNDEVNELRNELDAANLEIRELREQIESMEST